MLIEEVALGLNDSILRDLGSRNTQNGNVTDQGFWT